MIVALAVPMMISTDLVGQCGFRYPVPYFFRWCGIDWPQVKRRRNCRKKLVQVNIFPKIDRTKTCRFYSKMSNGNKTHQWHEPWNTGWLIIRILISWLTIIPIKLGRMSSLIKTQPTGVNWSLPIFPYVPYLSSWFFALGSGIFILAYERIPKYNWVVL